MSSVVIFRARHVMSAMGLMVAFLGNASASPNTLTVQDPRPVAEAILELDMRYGWQITYEDPLYIHYSDLTDVTDTDWPGTPVQSLSQLQAAQQPGVNNRTLVPKGGSLTFTLPSADPDELERSRLSLKPITKAIAALNLLSCKAPACFMSCHGKRGGYPETLSL